MEYLKTKKGVYVTDGSRAEVAEYAPDGNKRTIAAWTVVKQAPYSIHDGDVTKRSEDPKDVVDTFVQVPKDGDPEAIFCGAFVPEPSESEFERYDYYGAILTDKGLKFAFRLQRDGTLAYLGGE